MDKYDDVIKFKKRHKYSKALRCLLNDSNEINTEFRDDLNHSWYLVAILLYRKKDTINALYAFKKSLFYWSLDSQAIFAIGNCYSDLGKPKSAIPFYKRSFAISKNIKAIYNLGNAYFDLQQYDYAIKYYNKIDKFNTNTEVFSLSERNKNQAMNLINKKIPE